MPYDETTGRITAPVSVDDVRRALGIGLDEPGALDVGTLCCRTDKINQASILRPYFYKDPAGSQPGRGNEEHKDLFGTNSLPSRNAFYIPEGKESEVYSTEEGAAKAFRCTDLPCHNKDYVFNTNNRTPWYQYESVNFGYFVPFVNDVQDIFALRDLYWKRYTPADAAWKDNGNGTKTQTETWCVLDQFEGYISTGDPAPVLSNVICAYGQHPQCTPYAPGPNDAKSPEDVLSKASDESLKGGIVNVPAIFGHIDGLYYGASFFKKDASGGMYLHKKSAMGIAPGASTDGGYPLLSAIEFDSVLKECYGAIFIPWVCDKPFVQDSGGTWTPQTGTKFYGLNCSADHKAYVVPDNANFSPKKLDASMSDCRLVSGTKWRCEVTFTNRIANYPLIAILGNLEVKVTTLNGTATKTIASGSYSTDHTGSEIKVGMYKDPTIGIMTGALAVKVAITFDLSNSEEAQSAKLYFTTSDRNNQYTVNTEQDTAGGFVNVPPDIPNLAT